MFRGLCSTLQYHKEALEFGVYLSDAPLPAADVAAKVGVLDAGFYGYYVVDVEHVVKALIF